MSEAPLTSREALFVAEYIKGTSAEAAAIAAGYAPGYARSRAYKLLERPAIAAAIAETRAKLRDDTEMTAERLLGMFVEAYDKAIEWRQSTGAVRAGEMIGKLTGLIQDKLKLEVEAKPSLMDAIEAGRLRAGGTRGVAPPLMIDVTPKTKEPAE